MSLERFENAFIEEKILLTGANGGLGRAIAEKAPAEGAHLALWRKRRNWRKRARASLPDSTNSIALAADITDENAVQAMVEQTISELGGLDGVVNNAVMLADDDAMPADTPLKAGKTRPSI